MNPPLGIDWEIWVAIAAIASGMIIALSKTIWNFAQWKIGLDHWKGGVSTTLNVLQTDVKSLMTDVGVIKTNLEKSIKNGMVGRRSPFVASPEAIEVLEQVNLLTEIDANYLYIVENVNERSKLPIYIDIKGLERKFIEIAPGVIHELIKAGKIEEKKIDLAMEKLEDAFKAGAVGYYAVLLVITAYILEKVREKGYLADVSMVYSQIDAMSSESPDELLETFGGDLDRAIESYETAVRTMGEIGTNELAEKQLKLAFLYDEAGRKDEALERLKEAIKIKSDFAEAHNNLGVLLRDLNRFDEAEKELREAIKYKPDHAGAHNNLGFLMYELERFDEAEKEYREAIKYKPDFAMAHANLGIIISTSDRQEEAIQEFNIALNLKDQLPDKGERIIQLLESLKTSQS